MCHLLAKPINNSAARDYLLHCNYLPSFENVSIFAHKNKTFLSEIKEKQIMGDNPSLNRKALVPDLCSYLIKYLKDFWFILW